jgi:hypothetical protein
MICGAQLSGDDTCTAAGLTARSSSPVLALCRMLVEVGHDPSMPLHVYRGDVLALTVRSIAEAAALQVNARGTGFRPLCEVGAASPSDLNDKRVAA